MKKNVKSGIIILVVIVAVIIGLGIYEFIRPANPTPTITFTYEKTTPSDSPAEKNVPKNFKNKYIAKLFIEGTIETSNSDYNQEWLLSTINRLKNDKKNAGLAIYINSPGGAVYQADEVYLALQDYKTKGKPVYVYMGPMAASGGYYISCAGDEIWANRNTLTGSIGVIFQQFIDASELLDNIGIKIATTHSGNNKLMGSISQPYTQEQLDIMQSICDECYDQFCSIVVSQRHMSFEKVYALADGRIYTANQALNNGLIDRIDSFDNMIKELSEKITGTETTLKTVSFSREKKQSFMQMLMSTSSKINRTKVSANLGIPEKILESLSGFGAPAYIYRN